MKNFFSKFLILSILLVSVFGSVAFAEDPYTLIEKTYDFTNFDHINVDTAFKANITQGDNYSVSITASKYLEDKLDIRMEGSTLYIALKKNIDVKKSKFEANIVVPNLLSIEALGASNVTGTLDLSELTCTIKEASTLELKGTISDLTVNADQASKAHLKGLTAGQADITAKSSSTVDVTVTDTVNADALFSSKINIFGNPQSENVTKDFTSEITGADLSTVSAPQENNNEVPNKGFNFDFNFNFPMNFGW